MFVFLLELASISWFLLDLVWTLLMFAGAGVDFIRFLLDYMFVSWLSARLGVDLLVFAGFGVHLFDV